MENESGLLKAVYDLESVVRALGVGIALSFLAYLIGSFSEGLLTEALRRGGFYMRRSGFPRLDFGHSLLVSQKGAEALRILVGKKFRTFADQLDDAGLSPSANPKYREVRASASWLPQSDDSEIDVKKVPASPDWDLALRELRSQSEVFPEDSILQRESDTLTVRVGDLLPFVAQTNVVTELMGELDLVATRLIARAKEVFSQYDRVRAESDLRLALVPPLVVLNGIIAWQAVDSLWARLLWGLIGLVVIALFYWQALRLHFTAGDMLADALRAGTVDAPPLDELQAKIDQIIQEHKAKLRRQAAD